ncbi:MAG: alpha-L-fucosidase C-terminal domain-containing protein, partial [Roseiflexaceae bacterium]
AFTDTERADFTGQDVRFTMRGDTLYAIIMAWPGAHARINALGSASGHMAQIRSVELIGYDAPVTWRQQAEALVVDMPAAPIGNYAVVLRIR